MRVLLLGATGTIGTATARALVTAGHALTCIVRPTSAAGASLPGDARIVCADVTDPAALRAALAHGCDAVVSCLASRSGAPNDAWAIDHRANSAALDAARNAGVGQFVLLSAICLQKPVLPFQHAKLAFEAELAASGLDWSVVRPTAYFKSLSGQIERLRRGKPFLLFGSGRATACKPIGDDDLARYIAQCLTDPACRNQILPVGGPGPAITPVEQGAMLFRLLARPPRYRRIPVAAIDAVAGGLRIAGRVLPRARHAAGFAAIARYYATESMLVWDATAGRYDADATPSFGTQTLWDHYARLVATGAADDRGDHALF